MNLPTLIAGLAVIAVIGSVIISQIRSRKKGKGACSCGCDCACCSMNGSCHPKK
ncbi:MAG: FeoB-associated Cys-rich membrane protein [Faecousia sp.]